MFALHDVPDLEHVTVRLIDIPGGLNQCLSPIQEMKQLFAKQ